jgi:hypothetical protein
MAASLTHNFSRALARVTLGVMLLTLRFQTPARAAQLDTKPVGIDSAAMQLSF